MSMFMITLDKAKIIELCDQAGAKTSGSKGSMWEPLQVAMCLDVFLMVAFGIRMYSRKQSLDHRPRP